MADRNTHSREGVITPFKLAASITAEAGKMAAVNAAGYGQNADDAAGLTVVGMFDQTVDNSDGANGDLSATVVRKRLFKFKNSGTAPVTQASVGKDVYVEDDETVAIASGPTNDIVAGKCMGIETDGVWVAIG